MIISIAIIIFLVMDPVGNLPLFISILKKFPPKKQRLIIIRESLIALGILMSFVLMGQRFLKLLQISETSIELSGGVILMIIALKMIFSSSDESNGRKENEEPLIVPLAVPLIAGPSAISVVILQTGRENSLLVIAAALLLAWTGSTVILLLSDRINKLFGQRFINALESLMGLLLAAVAMQMFINGIKTIFS